MRSIVFSSSRTLPGQSCAVIAASAAGDRLTFRPARFDARCRKCTVSSDDVVLALAQRRHPNDDDAQSIVEIAPKALLRHRALQIDVRRGDDAHVDVTEAMAADRANLAFLEHAQQLDLHPEGGVAELVEEDGAGVALLEDPARVGNRAGERAPHMAEELGLEQRLRHRAAVDRDERTFAAAAVRVDRASHELLARAALTENQHRRRGIGGVRNLLVDREHAGGAAEEAGRAHLLPHRRLGRGGVVRRERPLDGRLHLADVERLADVVESPGAHRSHLRSRACRSR